MISFSYFVFSFAPCYFIKMYFICMGIHRRIEWKRSEKARAHARLTWIRWRWRRRRRRKQQQRRECAWVNTRAHSAHMETRLFMRCCCCCFPPLPMLLWCCCCSSSYFFFPNAFECVCVSCEWAYYYVYTPIVLNSAWFAYTLWNEWNEEDRFRGIIKI